MEYVIVNEETYDAVENADALVVVNGVASCCILEGVTANVEEDLGELA